MKLRRGFSMWLFRMSGLGLTFGIAVTYAGVVFKGGFFVRGSEGSILLGCCIDNNTLLCRIHRQ
jgi:hypothetical protein